MKFTPPYKMNARPGFDVAVGRRTKRDREPLGAGPCFVIMPGVSACFLLLLGAQARMANCDCDMMKVAAADCMMMPIKGAAPSNG